MNVIEGLANTNRFGSEIIIKRTKRSSIANFSRSSKLSQFETKLSEWRQIPCKRFWPLVLDDLDDCI